MNFLEVGRKACLIMLMGLISIAAYGEKAKMNIASFGIDEADQTANITPTAKDDDNGERCALIKINTTQRGFRFDVGMLGITEVQEQNIEHPSQIWLYVPHDVMKITIQHPMLGIIKDYDLGTRLKEGRTYVMDLTSDDISTIRVDYENEQVLDIKVTPSSAELYINGMQQPLNTRGEASVPLKFGNYNYRVVAPNYHLEEGNFIINDKANHHKLNVNLKQAFGYLNVKATSDSKGATLYVDDSRVGELPVSNFPLASGMHTIAIHQKLFEPYTEKVAMTDSGTVVVTPILRPNSAEYEITVADRDARIYDNGELLGTGTWKGLLEAGEHLIEVKKPSHSTVAKKVIVVKGEPRKLPVSAPAPIYGTLEITSQPSGAEVTIDGTRVGVTPYVTNSLLVGAHSVGLAKKGHKAENFEVNIRESDPTRVSKKLTDFCNINIYTSPSYASIYVNNERLGSSPAHLERVAGDYTIEAYAHGHTSYSKKMHLDGTSTDIHINLHRNYTRPNEFYIRAGYNVVGMQAMDFGLGFYASNFNLEANYLLGLGKSEDIYWTFIESNEKPFSVAYKPWGFNASAGWGIRLFNRGRLTPQLGCQAVWLNEQRVESFDYYGSALEGAMAVSLRGALRLHIAIAPCLGISVTPEYLFGIHKTDGYTALSEISDKIKSWSDGFGCNVALHLFF